MSGIACAVVASGARIDVSFGVSGSGTCIYMPPGQTACTASRSHTATPSGGSGSYTYLWSLTANPGGVNLGNATGQTCNVSKSANEQVGGYGYTLQCRVTDAVLGVSATESAGSFTLNPINGA